MHCSQACSDAQWSEWEAKGQTVNFSDITPERANELLITIGLKLEGVGKVNAS